MILLSWQNNSSKQLALRKFPQQRDEPWTLFLKTDDENFACALGNPNQLLIMEISLSNPYPHTKIWLFLDRKNEK